MKKKCKTIAEALKYYYSKNLEKGEIKIGQGNKVRLTATFPSYNNGKSLAETWGRSLRKILNQTIEVEFSYHDKASEKVKTQTVTKQSKADFLSALPALRIIMLLIGMMFGTLQTEAQTGNFKFEETLIDGKETQQAAFIYVKTDSVFFVLYGDQIKKRITLKGQSADGGLVFFLSDGCKLTATSNTMFARLNGKDYQFKNHEKPKNQDKLAER